MLWNNSQKVSLIAEKKGFGSDTIQIFKHIYPKMMGPIYSHLVAMREWDMGIFPDHKFRGVVKISLDQWTKTLFR